MQKQEEKRGRKKKRKKKELNQLHSEMEKQTIFLKLFCDQKMVQGHQTKYLNF